MDLHAFWRQFKSAKLYRNYLASARAVIRVSRGFCTLMDNSGRWTTASFTYRLVLLRNRIPVAI